MKLPFKHPLFILGFLFILSAGFAKKTILINGAGASFPYILYSKWFYEYAKSHPNVRINYRSIGSGGGIRQLIRGTLDFGASDVPMSPRSTQNLSRPILHIPTTLSAVVVTYNISGIKKPLKLTSSLIGRIFSGRISKWNHEDLVKINPELKFINKNIVVIYRADGSGTTSVFTRYLAQADPQWNLGYGKSIRWPVGVGGKGNEGCLGLIQKIDGSISYLGMGYAIRSKLPLSMIQNQAKKFILPSIQNVQQAAKVMDKAHKDYLKPLTNPKDPKSYPLASYSFLLVYQQMKQKKGKPILDFLNWALTKGQSYHKDLYYIPLPKNVLQEAKKTVQMISIK